MARGKAESSTGSKVWTKAEIERFLATEDLKYQQIELPHGLKTPGANRDELCELAFQGDISNMSVLDIGSYLGYFCLRSLELGAKSAHGLEIDPEKIRQATAIAEMKGLEPKYSKVDFEKHAFSERYDIVLALNILHHLYDPIQALQRLARMSKHRLVLEVASINARDSRKLSIGFFTRLVISKLPIIFVAPGIPGSKRTSIQKFFMTPQATQRILMDHTKLFAKVEVCKSTFKERFILVATRRKIGHLLIVSGPTSSGKSTFLKMLKEGKLPEAISRKLPKNCRDWQSVGATQFTKNSKKNRDHWSSVANPLEGLVLHYDTMRPHARGFQEYDRDQVLDLIACADKTTVIVLETELDQLCKQLVENEIAKFGVWQKVQAFIRQKLHVRQDSSSGKAVRVLEKLVHRRLNIKQRSRHETLLNLYRQPGWLIRWNQRWRHYLEAHASRPRVISVKWPPKV